MSKKYFVYISSSQEDVKAERRELIKIVTELGAIPITMDAFDVTMEEERKIIGKVIEECDYFLNLTAYKGGGAVGKSFGLEFEYSCAVRANVPVFALIIGEKARWKASKKEKTNAAQKAVANFKKKLEGHTHDTWINLTDLRQKAMALLNREMNLSPRRGWVPSTEAVEPCVANELCRLLRENEALRYQIRMYGPDAVKKVQDEIKHYLKVMAANKISLSFYYVDGDNWENTQVYHYLKLFRILAPELSTPKTTVEISHFLGIILNPDLDRTVRKDYPTPSNTVKKIMSDFALLKLVKCSAKTAPNAPVVDDEDWELTEYGQEAYAVYRLHQLEKFLVKRPESEEKAEDEDSSTKT